MAPSLSKSFLSTVCGGSSCPLTIISLTKLVTALAACTPLNNPLGPAGHTNNKCMISGSLHGLRIAYLLLASETSCQPLACLHRYVCTLLNQSRQLFGSLLNFLRVHLSPLSANPWERRAAGGSANGCCMLTVPGTATKPEALAASAEQHCNGLL